MASQTDRLKELLKDGAWHSTPDIQINVYGANHLGVARIGARVFDLKRRLPPHQTVESRPSKGNPAVWEYRLADIQEPRYDLFQGMTGEAS